MWVSSAHNSIWQNNVFVVRQGFSNFLSTAKKSLPFFLVPKKSLPKKIFWKKITTDFLYVIKQQWFSSDFFSKSLELRWFFENLVVIFWKIGSDFFSLVVIFFGKASPANLSNLSCQQIWHAGKFENPCGKRPFINKVDSNLRILLLRWEVYNTSSCSPGYPMANWKK